MDDPLTTARFQADYRRTSADLVAANYYGRFRDLTLQGGLRGTHPESGGPFFTHWIDALQCEGINDIPMGEFWKRNREPNGPITNDHNPSLKQAASAAHTYGKWGCQAEAFTSFADDWIDDPWSMKDIGDAAFCEGLNRNVLCFWVHQPRLDAKPGFQWAHVGTHFDCNLTWWPMSGAWLTYLARCQHLLRQGLFVADFAYLQEEAIPGFLARAKRKRPALPAGFDYDVLNAEVLLGRASCQRRPADAARRHELSLPRAPAPAAPAAGPFRPPCSARSGELAEGGVTVIGPQPDRAPGLTGFPQCDAEIRALAARMWGPSPAADGQRALGKGRIFWGRDLGAIARSDGLVPDIEFRKMAPLAEFDWIHRRHGDWEIYFVSNQASTPAACDAAFRVVGKQPELWDAVTGRFRALPQFRGENGRTTLPLAFAPRQSLFVVFHDPAGVAGAGIELPRARRGGQDRRAVGGVVRSEMGRTGKDHVRNPAGLDPKQGRRHPLLQWHGRLSEAVQRAALGDWAATLSRPRRREERRSSEAQRPGRGRGLDGPLAGQRQRSGAGQATTPWRSRWPTSGPIVSSAMDCCRGRSG